mmetsp:Transcript_15344/g.46337  ORF Transcript_15344/g.46337 Transcript_15344/m.46337 type:complete len:226 (+) Transcript_15344:1165-1842(+)
MAVMGAATHSALLLLGRSVRPLASRVSSSCSATLLPSDLGTDPAAESPPLEAPPRKKAAAPVRGEPPRRGDPPSTSAMACPRSPEPPSSSPSSTVNCDTSCMALSAPGPLPMRARLVASSMTLPHCKSLWQNASQLGCSALSFASSASTSVSVFSRPCSFMPSVPYSSPVNRSQPLSRFHTCGSVASSGGRCSREAKWKLLIAAARARLTSTSAICSALRQLHAT